MQSWYFAYNTSLVAAILTSTALTWLLWKKGGATPGRRPLAIFCFGIAAWAAGHFLASAGTSSQASITRIFSISLLSLSPLVAAAYLHFALLFAVQNRRTTCLVRELFFIYGPVLLICLVAIGRQAGDISPWLVFPGFFRYTGFAWVIAFSTIVISAIGHLILFNAAFSATGQTKRQLLAVLSSGLWGFLASSGFLHPSFSFDHFPYQVILMPGYTFILVYGILRYELMEFNRWFRQALTWFLLICVVFLVVTLIVATAVKLGVTDFQPVSFYLIWAGSLASFLIAYNLYPPLQKLATRWVFPGAELSATRLDYWRENLMGVTSWKQLISAGEKLLGEHLLRPVVIDLGSTALAGEQLRHATMPDNPVRFVCRARHGTWQCKSLPMQNNQLLSTPGQQLSAEVFGTMLATSANRLQQSLEFAETKEKQLRQTHLAELGHWSASIAHELRNPLNIIAMANNCANQSAEQEIGFQLERANRLIDDLLTYSGEIRIERQSIKLVDYCEYLLTPYRDQHTGISQVPIRVEHSIPDDLILSVDVQRFQQVIVNLMDNAVRALAKIHDPIIRLSAKQHDGRVRVYICDNGCGIEPEFRENLFRPFCSNQRSGNGLGLAIIKRILKAHGGTVVFRSLLEDSRDTINTCFELRFPASI